MTEQFTIALGELKNTIDAKLAEHTAEVQKYGKASTDLTGSIDELSDKYKSLNDKIAELAQRQDSWKSDDSGKIQTVGASFIKSDAFKSLVNGERQQVKLDVKAVFSDATTTFATNRDGVIAGNFAPLTIRSRIPVISVDSGTVDAIRELANTNNAAEVAQGAAKPESDVTFEKTSVNIRTIAHWIKVSNQLLSDAPAIASYIDVRARDGLAQRIEGQLMNGLGTGDLIKGFTAAGNFTAFTPVSGANLADSINKAKYQLWATGNMPDTVFVNPADWSALELLREGAGTGQYLYGAPGTAGGMSPFGVPIVMSNHVAAGTFLIGNVGQSAVLFEREGATVEMGYINDDFTRNLVTIRVEERLALSVDRPAGMLYGNITAA